MATIPQPRRTPRLPRQWAPIAIAAALAIAAAVSFALPRLRAGSATTTAQTAAATSGALTAGITATGRIEPRTTADLVFATRQGRVSEVLVQAGDTVAAGDPLVRLDSRQQAAGVAAAQAALAQAQADLQALREGATKDEIAAARAQVAAAQGSLEQTAGSVTPSDLTAARAQLDEARARLATLTGTPNQDDLARAQADVTAATAALDQQRSALSATKEQARQSVESSANRLRDAQAAFATARDNLSSVQSDGKDPLTGLSLTDAGKRSYQDAYDRAERAMKDADAALAQARVAYEDAKQKEASGLDDAQARVASARATLAALLNPSAETLAAARAQLAAAEARIAQLTGGQRSGALAAQQANLEAAQAKLAQLTADPRATDLARAEARVAQAQANLELAQAQLDDLTLRAPFAGTVARVDVAPGEDPGAASPVTLIDTGRVQVTVTVDEVDVTRVRVGQPAEVLIDAIGAPALRGSVVRIAPVAEQGTQVTSYEVKIEIAPGDRPVRPGMTASATIIADQRERAISVPAAAVRTEGGSSVVTVVTTGTDGQRRAETRQVQVGGTFGDRVEVLGGLREGELVQVGDTNAK